MAPGPTGDAGASSSRSQRFLFSRRGNHSAGGTRRDSAGLAGTFVLFWVVSPPGCFIDNLPGGIMVVVTLGVGGCVPIGGRRAGVSGQKRRGTSSRARKGAIFLTGFISSFGRWRMIGWAISMPRKKRTPTSQKSDKLLFCLLIQRLRLQPMFFFKLSLYLLRNIKKRQSVISCMK